MGTITINYVSLTCPYVDGQGDPITTGYVTFTPNTVVTDAADNIILTQYPVTVNLAKQSPANVQLVATDNAGLNPPGWGWVIAPNFPGAPPAQLFLVPFTGGASQSLADLMPATSVPTVYTSILVSGVPSTGQVPTATSPIAASWQNASGGVSSVTATDGSVVVTGSGSAVTLATGTLDAIATAHPPAAAVAMNAKKITGLANGTASSDGAAFGQIPTSLPPSGSAAGTGDLTGTFPGAVTLAKIQGTTVATPPGGTTQYLRADGTWAVPAGSGGGGGATIDSAAVDIQPLGTRAAGSIGLAADSGHVHPPTGLQTASISSTTADFQPLGTAAAGSTGRLADAGHIHPPTGVAILDATSTDIAALGTRAAGAVGKAADAGHVHPLTGLQTAVIDTTATDIAALGTQAAGATGKLADAGHVHPPTGVALLAGATFTGFLAPAVVTLTFGTTVSVNAALGNVFALTLTASTGTIANPSNPVDGQVIRLRLIQDGTGSRTVAWGTAYDWGAGNSAPVLTTTASKIDVAAFEYVASISKWISLGAAFPQAF